MLYAPASFVIAEAITPVAVLVVLMETPGSTAAEESKAVPVIVALLACPNAAVAARHVKSNNNVAFPTMKIRFIIGPPKRNGFEPLRMMRSIVAAKQIT